jgi:predicted esterase
VEVFREVVISSVRRRFGRCGSFVALGLLVAVSLTAAEERDRAELQRDFQKAYRAGHWGRAIELGLEIEDRVPGHPIWRYNLACVYALSGDPESAVMWLQRAADAGFAKPDHMAADPDLDELRRHEHYPSVMGDVVRNQELLRRAIRERFEASPPVVDLPRGYDRSKAAPLVIALHGLGGRAAPMAEAWSVAASRFGALVVAPQAVRPVADGFSWNDPDEAAFILELTLEWVRQRYLVDEDRLVLTGFSQGGFMAMALGVREAMLFEGVVPMAGGYLPEIDRPPPAEEGAPRFYFMVGALDRPVEAVRQAAHDFEAAGYEVDLRVFPGTGHTFPRNTDRELGKALRFVLSRR